MSKIIQEKKSAAKGFTLIEGLVSLTICSFALVAVLNVFHFVSSSVAKVESQSLANLSAENAFNQVWLDKRLIFVSKKKFECPQASFKFECQRFISPTPHLNFKKIEIKVFDETGKLLVHRIAFKGIGF